MERACRVMACVGAVIGAGFASGKEIGEFFTRYGGASWALILLSAAVMGALSLVIMRRGAPGGAGIAGKACFVLLWSVTGGAMLSAGGELISLVLPVRGAYMIGIAATLGVGRALSLIKLRGLGSLGLLLSLFFAVVCALLITLPSDAGAALPKPPDTGASLLRAGISAVCYAGLNIAVGMGVIEKCAAGARGADARVAAGFAVSMAALMLLCNAVLISRPEAAREALPMVMMLSRLGVKGFYMGAALLYMALITTLAAIFCSLSGAFSRAPGRLPAYLPMLPPLIVSLIGFQGIISGVYPVVGMICLVLILFTRGRR